MKIIHPLVQSLQKINIDLFSALKKFYKVCADIESKLLGDNSLTSIYSLISKAKNISNKTIPLEFFIKNKNIGFANSQKYFEFHKVTIN